MSKLLAIAGGSTLLYIVLSVWMAVLPGIELSQVPPGKGVEQLTLLQQRGRDVYVSEGCAYCHTQQVRPTPVDRVFGRPSAPGDFAFQTPELLESERTGPDLTNIGVRQPSDVWQYIHLYDPRAVVPQSVMPAFPFLFKVVNEAPKGVQPVPLPKAFAPAHGVVIPSAKAQALVAYLMSLKQPPLPKGESSGVPGGAVAQASATPPSPTPASSPAGGAASTFDASAGSQLFAAHCSACHGAQGAGVPGVFPPLAGNPVVNDKDPTEHMTVVLHGLHGKAINGTTYAAQMPSFAAQLSDEQIANIIDHERTSWGNHAPTVTAKDVAAVRAKK
ncbi:MAG: c-type cytochrome [Candidimonas sp.]|nr:MAG: c-type cytochrome [Candidimonas sp.]